jgi:hypothetical protein
MVNELQPTEGIAKLLEGFEVLREAASPKVWSTGLRGGQLLPGPSALEGVAHKFMAEAKDKQSPPSPPPDPEKARRQWRLYLTTRDPSQIERRAVRSLCWDPEIAATTAFLRLIEGYDRPPSAHMIHGLLGVYHLQWGNRNDDLEHCVTKWLHDYRGYNQILLHIAEVVDEVVGPYAAIRAASHCVSDGSTSARALLTQRGLALNTPYASAVAEALLNVALRKLERTQELQEARNLCEGLIPADRDLLLPQVFVDAVKELIRVASSGPSSLTLRDTVKDFVLREERLGDPRRNSTQWTSKGLVTEAETVTSWLSEEDLRFFFDSIMKGQPDPHGRYQFWLRYVDRVRNFRVAIGEKYRQSHRVELDGLKKRGRSYAELDDWDASAFIMDFGPVIVVEFSQTGNACSAHEAKAGREKIGDLRANKFYKSKLKRPLRSQGWFRHDPDGNWKREVRQYLSRPGFGVRESYGR